MSDGLPDGPFLGVEPGVNRDGELGLWDWVLSYSIQPQDLRADELDLDRVRGALEIAYNRQPQVVEVRGDDLYVEVVVREASGYEATRYPYPRLGYAMKRAGVGDFQVTHDEAQPLDGDWEPWLRWVEKQNEGKL